MEEDRRVTPGGWGRGASSGAPRDRRKTGPVLWALLLFLLAPARAEAPLVIAAASSLGPPLRELAERYRAEQGVPVKVVLGSSGKLFAQVQKGAPYALYLPADPVYLKKLPAGKLKAEPVPFARGRLALYLHPRLQRIPEGPEALEDPAIRRVAIANPKLAPYGRAALAVLEHYGLIPVVRHKLVFTESVAQAASLAAFAADAAWIDLASARKLGGPYWLAPRGTHPPLYYAAGLLDPRGRPFLTYLQSPKAREILAKYGLEAP